MWAARALTLQLPRRTSKTSASRADSRFGNDHYSLEYVRLPPGRRRIDLAQRAGFRTLQRLLSADARR